MLPPREVTPMKRRTRALAAITGLMLAGAAVPASAQSPPENPIPDGFKLAPMSRASILVRDQEESLKLYRDILGLRVRFDQDFANQAFNQILGTEGLTIKAKVLQSGDAVYGNLGVFQLVGGDRAQSPAPFQGAAVRTGDVAVVFMTNDIEGIADKVTAAGYTVISPPMVLFPSDDMAVQPLEMLFRDRDGILVNLIQAGRKRGE
jgi:catechol 2,3-dioxygenase-like lactoylglutathione lyase family enzyme